MFPTQFQIHTNAYSTLWLPVAYNKENGSRVKFHFRFEGMGEGGGEGCVWIWILKIVRTFGIILAMPLLVK